MSNIVTLHKRQVPLPDGADYAQMRVYLSETSTQVEVFADAALTQPLFQPIESDASGVFPPMFVATGAAMRLVVTDNDDVPIPGYTQDFVTPETTDTVGASGITFQPTPDIPVTNVQAAIEYVQGLIGDDGAGSRPFIPWPTGGTGDNFTITPTPAIIGYQVGQSFLVRPNRYNSGASTLEINGLGQRALRKYGVAGTPVALGVNDIQPGREFQVYDDGSQLLITLGRNEATRGSATTGFYTRIGDYQFCYGLVELLAPGSGGTNAAGSWTYPAAFLGQPMDVRGILAGSAWTESSTTVVDEAGIGIDALGPVLVGPASSTAATFRVYRQQGAANFPANGKLYCRVSAVGRFQ